MGGVLANPAATLPDLFDSTAVFGFDWIKNYPYALPSVLNALLLFVVALAVFFGLEEVIF